MQSSSVCFWLHSLHTDSHSWLSQCYAQQMNSHPCAKIFHWDYSHAHSLPECLHIQCSALVQTTSFWAWTQKKPIETTEILEDCCMALSRKNKYNLTATVMLLLHRRALCNLVQRFVHGENFLRQFLMGDWESHGVQAMSEPSCQGSVHTICMLKNF